MTQEYIYLLEKACYSLTTEENIEYVVESAFGTFLKAKETLNTILKIERKNIRQHFAEVKQRLQEEYSELIKKVSSSSDKTMEEQMIQLKSLSQEIDNISDLQLVELDIKKKDDENFTITMSNGHLNWVCSMKLTKIKLNK